METGNILLLHYLIYNKLKLNITFTDIAYSFRVVKLNINSLIYHVFKVNSSLGIYFFSIINDIITIINI